MIETSVVSVLFESIISRIFEMDSFMCEFFPAVFDSNNQMAQNDESLRSHTKSPNSHLPCVTCPDSSISSFDLLKSYHSAAIFLKAAADSHNPRKSITLSNMSPLKQHCSSPPDGNTAAAASLISRPPCQHSPTTSSKIQAAFVMAMAASSPPSTCPSSSSSGGHQGDRNSASEFRTDTQSSTIGAFFRPPPTAYESVDGGGDGDCFPPPNSTGALPPFVPFTSSSTGSSDLSASTCLTNAMLLPASIVNVLGQQVSRFDVVCMNVSICMQSPHLLLECGLRFFILPKMNLSQN